MEAYAGSGTSVRVTPNPELVIDLALRATASGIWSVDLNTNDVTWTAEVAAVLGIPDDHEYAIRDRLLELIEPLVVTARNFGMWQDFDLEQCHRTPTGETRWIRFLARPHGDTDTARLVGVATDVTRQHNDRQELAGLSDRYRLLVELSPDGICVHESGTLVYVNPAAARFIGAQRPEDLLGKPITDLVQPVAVPEMLRRIASLDSAGETTAPAEVKLKRLDGSTLPVESVAVRTTWRGRPAYQVIMRDITTQKSAQEALRFQAALVSHVSDAIVATTEDGVVTSWNPAAEAVYGHSARAAVGRKVGDLVGAPLDPATVVTQGGVVETAHRRTDGTTLTIRVSAAAMNDGYVLVCADETARTRAERRYSTVVAALDEGVVVIGENGLVESANPAAGRILGLPVHAMIGCSPSLYPLYDAAGDRVRAHDYPSAVTSRTGRTEHGRVLRAERPDGRSVWLSMSCRPLDPSTRPPTAVVMSFTDITERRAIGRRLEHDATHDPLTGLANRTLVLRRLATALRDPHRTGTLCVLFLDLDKFKVINDSLGHNVGDEVLRIAGQRLRHCVRHTDLVSRLGGDEFAVVTFGLHRDSDIHALVEHLRSALTEPIDVDGRQLRIDASIGIVTAPPGDSRTPEDLIRDADVAMYQAKTRGRGRGEFFDVELRERIQRQLQLEQDLRGAVRHRQLWVAYQPVVDLRTCDTVAVEGLLRWDHPVHGLLPPAEFIPLAEESDLIETIGRHMLGVATSEIARERQRRGVRTRLTVNLSARQLDDESLVAAVADALRATGLPPGELCLEITESVLMREPKVAADVLTALRELGVRLAIDDFGTGYSSLAQLWKLPLDTLKIDRSFVTGLAEPGDYDAEAIVRGIITMAHAMNMSVIAEGVENERQVAILRELGCDAAQGYHFGKPVAVGELFAAEG